MSRPYFFNERMDEIMSTTISSLEDAERFIGEHIINSDGAFDYTLDTLGEEITINDGTYNAVWQVVGVDTELGKGDTPLFRHHISLIPKTVITLDKIQRSGIVDGYANSDMYTKTIPTIVTHLESVLGDHLLTRRVKLSNTTTPNRYMASGAEYYSVKANLLCAQQVFDTVENGAFGGNQYDTGDDIEQLPGFKTGKVKKHAGTWWWLRDITGYDGDGGYHYFHLVDYDGILNHFGFTVCSGGVRPLITIG
jgi:hypothetical protein